MPASRSTRHPLRAQHAYNFNAEVIVLSSDDEGPAPPPRKTPVPQANKTARQRSKARARRTPVVDPEDILEISSTEDDSAPQRRKSSSSRITLAQMQKQIAELRAVCSFMFLLVYLS